MLIIPDCRKEGVTYNESLDTDIRIEKPTSQPLVIDPQIMPSRLSQCPLSLVSVEVDGPDRDLFRSRVSELGVIVVDQVPPGSYIFSLEVIILGDVVKSLEFTTFVRDTQYVSPLPSVVSVKASYSSLIILDNAVELEILEDR